MNEVILGVLLFFGISIEESVTINLIVYNTCFYSLKYNESDCSLLGHIYDNNYTIELERQVQPFSNTIITTRTAIESLITAVLCLYYTSWSDKTGRKYTILICFTGYIVSYMFMLIISFFKKASPWLFLISSLLYSISGGFPTLNAALFSYLTDNTEEKDRTIRIGIFEALTSVSILGGSILSSYLLNNIGYWSVYLTSISCFILGWILSFILLSNTLSNKNKTQSNEQVHISLVNSDLKTIIQNDVNKPVVILLIVIKLLFMLTTFGSTTLIFMYLRSTFQWTVKEFTVYNGVKHIILFLGSITGPYLLHKMCNLQETVIILLGIVFTLISSIILALANENWQIYLSICIKCLGGTVNPMIHSLISKSVSNKHIGKMFGLLNSVQTISTFVIGMPIFTFIYNNSLSYVSNAFIYILCTIYLLEIILAGYLCKIDKTVNEN